MKAYLPDSYRSKASGVARKVLDIHRNLVGTSEISAKFEYVKMARNLPTFGVHFFLVRVRKSTQNWELFQNYLKLQEAKSRKMVPLLLGVSKDSIMRLDYDTKEIKETFPLHTVNRMAADNR